MSPDARNAHGKQTLVSADGKAYVIVAGPGSASVSVSGAGAAVVTSAALQVDNVPKTGSVLLSPTSLQFAAIGSSYAQDVRVAQGSYGGAFSERDDCARIATLAADRNGDGEAKYAVTPVGAGSCKATFTGGDGKSASLPISVAALGGVVLEPTSLSFNATGSANSKTVAVTQAKYAGSFTEADDCTKIATLAATANGGGSARYTVTPVGAGSCKATFTGGDGKSASLPISVTTLGGVVLKPTSLSFNATGSANSKTVAVTQAKYAGSFTEADDCTKIATLAATANGSGSARYTVTPVGTGSCKATFTGGDGKSASLPISVAALGGVVLEPTSLSFNATGSANSKTVAVTQAKYAGSFTEADDCTKIATLAAKSNSSGSARYTVTPVGAGSCKATFTGGDGKSASLPISVATLGGVVLEPTSLSFTAIGSANSKTVAVTQAKYAGSFTEADDCTKIATLAAKSNGSGSARYAVTPVGAGSCKATFTGGDGKSASLPISVAALGGVVLKPTSLSFNATGSANSKTVAVTQAKYAGSFTEADDCTKIATLAAKSNGRGSASYTVAPVGAGSCKATFTGGDGKSASLPISVAALGSVVLKPSSLTFNATGSANSKTVGVTQTKYGGSFTEADDCTNIATLSAKSNSGGSATYAVTPVGAGSCKATFTGGDGKSASLPIAVLGRVVLQPGSLSFTAVSSASAKTVTATQANFTGSFDESDTCGKVATLRASANSGGKATYTVTPTGPGACSARIAGGDGASASLPIAVTLPVPVIAVVCAQTADSCKGGSATSPGSVQFTAVGDTATLTPSAPNWSHAPNFTLKSDTCNKTDDPAAGGNWATIAPGVGLSASSFTLKAANAGTSSNKAKCSATFSDAAGRTLVVNVEVTLGNVGVH